MLFRDDSTGVRPWCLFIAYCAAAYTRSRHIIRISKYSNSLITPRVAPHIISLFV